ncbi:MAG: ribosome silencing factor [Clostridia bacterium]|nr:ribosome silencing factor [Clostridia bacterium]
MNATDKAQAAVKILDSKKAKDIVVLYVEQVTYICDYFVICTATNVRQLDALVRELCDKMAQKGIDAARVEGAANSGWILVDFGDVVVHLFKGDTREFYGLESLWSDAERVEPSLEEK